MDNSSFKSEFEKADAMLMRVFQYMSMMKDYYDEKDASAIFAEALKLAELSEKLTLQTRILPAYLGHPLGYQMMDQLLIETSGIFMGFTPQGWFMLQIPALLPKKQSGSAEYIRSMLYPSMRRFFAGKNPVCYHDSVVVFRHVYSRNRPERQYRDHDNIETNMVIDILALYLLPDDAPLRCAHFYCSILGNADYTEVFIIPQNEFLLWLSMNFCTDEFPEFTLSGLPP